MKKLIFTLGAFLVFTLLQAHVNLIYLAGGATFHPVDMVTIEWEIIIQHNTVNWPLYFSDDGGSTWQDQRLDIGVDTLIYKWIVPNEVTDQVRIKVVQGNEGIDYDDESENFTITSSQGIVYLNKLNGISISPNPAGSHIRLESEQILKNPEIKLMNNSGQEAKVYNLANQILQMKELTLNLDGIEAGIYFLIIKSEDKIDIEKVVKI